MMKPPVKRIPAKWLWHYRELSRLRERLGREHVEHSAALQRTIDKGGEDKIDAAEVEQEQIEVLAELQAEEVELAEIEAALTRLRLGTYGVCEQTGEPIAPARLRALPWTRWCARAAASREKTARLA